MSIEKSLEIENYVYTVCYKDNNEFIFYADGSKSKRPTRGYDPFEAFGDDEYYFGNNFDRVSLSVKSVFRLKKFVMSFIEEIIEKKKPYYFTYANIGDEKSAIYERYAMRIAEKYGYDIVHAGSTFHFTKK